MASSLALPQGTGSAANRGTSPHVIIVCLAVSLVLHAAALEWVRLPSLRLARTQSRWLRVALTVWQPPVRGLPATPTAKTPQPSPALHPEPRPQAKRARPVSARERHPQAVVKVRPAHQRLPTHRVRKVAAASSDRDHERLSRSRPPPERTALAPPAAAPPVRRAPAPGVDRTTPGPSTEAVRTAAATRDYTQTLTRWLKAHAVYPPLARLRGWEGVAKVRLKPAANNERAVASLGASSGYPLLDRQALELIRQALEARPPPKALVRGIDLVVPVVFRLNPR